MQHSKQFIFFSWLSNLKNLVILNGSTKVRNVIRMALELQHFLKHYKKLPRGGGLCPQTLVCDTFKLHYFTRHLSQFTIF